MSDKKEKSEKELLEELEEYNKTLEINPKDAITWYNKGIVLNGLGWYEDALLAYEESIKLDQKKANTFVNKGIVLDELKRYEEALTSYDKALDIDPKKVTALYNKGIALGKLKRYEEALTSYNKALDIDPKKVTALINKGFVLQKLKRYEEALTSYNKALDIDPKKVNAWTNKGEILEELERYDEAQQVYNRLTINIPELKEFSEEKIKEMKQKIEDNLEKNKKQEVQLKKIDHFQNSIDMLEKMSGINIGLTPGDVKGKTIGMFNRLWWLDDSFKQEERRWLAGILFLFLIFVNILLFPIIEGLFINNINDKLDKNPATISLAGSTSTGILSINLTGLEKEKSNQWVDIDWKVLKFELLLLVLLFFAVRQYSRAKALRLHTQYTLMNTYTLQSLISVTVANNISPETIIRDGMNEVFILESESQKSKSDLPIQETIKLMEIISKSKESSNLKTSKQKADTED